MKTLFMQTLEFLISEIYQNELTQIELSDSVKRLTNLFQLLLKIDSRNKQKSNTAMCNNINQNITNTRLNSFNSSMSL